MRRGWMMTGVTGIAAAFTLLLATGALAASPSRMHQDYAGAKDATVQGYGGPVTQVVTPEYCRNAQGQLLNASGQVVSRTSEAAPAGSGCKEVEYCRNAQ